MPFGDTAIADWLKIGLPALFFLICFKLLFTVVLKIPGLTPVAAWL